MMKLSINYSLLELIEGPKRVNSISRDTIFDYVEEALHDMVRFHDFMNVLSKNAPWAYLGLAIAASDMVPFKDIFGEKANSVTVGEYRRSAVNVMSAFTKMLGFFGQGLYYKENSKVDFILRYVTESLSEDEIKFFLDCVKQRDHELLYDAFKLEFENGHLDKNVREFFSFCINHDVESSEEVSNYGYVVKSWKKYNKIGSMYFDENNVLVDRHIADGWNRAIKRFIGVPNICEIYINVEANVPFLAMTVDAPISFVNNVSEIDDFWLVRELFNDVSMVVMVSSTNVYNVVSVSSTQKNTLRNVTYKCKGIRIFAMPLAILGKSISILSCKTENGEDINAFAPAVYDDKFTSGMMLNFVVYHNTYYLKGEENEKEIYL